MNLLLDQHSAGREPELELPNVDEGIQMEFDKAILRELQRKAEVNMDYVNSLIKCRDIFDTHDNLAMYITSVSVEIYRKWCDEARRLRPKVQKFRDRLQDKRGVAVSIRCVKVDDGFIFKEKASGQLCMPNILRSVKKFDVSILGSMFSFIQQEPELDEEQKDVLQDAVFYDIVSSNHTGNHYRNHYVRATNPYGHSPASGG